ncbi:energy transducer TonB [Hymenobacter glacialis]|uniref:TonB C-terminal domain-containing protein n=1 Tax=Hymenobacter glacialis TaxID=1908236 RepID=A0A1G1SYI0_9BACT|nr:energy transducer TonB [Hymenobacter glacialis]OGX83666.1 hypothetical protein BEN48_16875 [Hymenobacter glacialis]
MKYLLPALFVAIALQLGTAPTAQAQAPTSATTYSGPRYPGGPDSLRALVYRSTRITTPAPAGKMLVQFELQPDGKAFNFTMVRPPDPMNKALVDATAAARNYVEANMLAWQLDKPGTTGASIKAPKISLAMEFTTLPAAQAYYYADHEPVFKDATEALRATFSKFRVSPNDSVQQHLFASPSRILAEHIQSKVKYPPNALRSGQQGQVYVYFEVAENGAIDNPQVVGTAGKYLDDEVLKVVKNLSAASAPAQLRGQPVRVYYTLPINFKIVKPRS